MLQKSQLSKQEILKHADQSPSKNVLQELGVESGPAVAARFRVVFTVLSKIFSLWVFFETLCDN